MATNAVTYIANLGKSVSYAAVDKFKTLSPTATEFVETNHELFKETYSSIRNYRTTYKKVGNIIKSSKISAYLPSSRFRETPVTSYRSFPAFAKKFLKKTIL